MSNSVRHHRRQPTRLPCPWDSPGKNTQVGCHFLLQCMKVKSESEVAQSFLTHSDPKDYSPPGSSVHGIFQAKVLEWVAIAFSAGKEEKRKMKLYQHRSKLSSIITSLYGSFSPALQVFQVNSLPYLKLRNFNYISKMTSQEHLD